MGDPGRSRRGTHRLPQRGNGVFYAEIIRLLGADTLVAVSTNDSTIRGGRIAEGLARMALGQEAAIPEKRGAAGGGGATSLLGSEGRDAVVRAWFSAYNAPGVDAMHAFRKDHASARPGVAEADRERQLERLRRDLGHLDVVGVLSRGDRGVAVRAKGSEGPQGTFRFVFTPEGKLDGVEVGIGE